jgi:hypothetical protein
MRLLKKQGGSVRKEGVANLAIQEMEQTEVREECGMRSSEICAPFHISLERTIHGRQ